MSVKLKKSCMNALNEINTILNRLKELSDQEFEKDVKLRAKVRTIYNELSVFEGSNPEISNILAPIGLNIYRNKNQQYWLKQLEETKLQLEYWIHG